MGLTKTDSFSDRQNELAQFMKALGHPARIAIVEHLLKVSNCMCGGIVDVLPLAQPTVSQHLKELKNAGIIKGDIDGTSVCYCIDADNWRKYHRILDIMFSKYKSKTKCC
jgi:ArsR family transcriptional regulator, arsenate/arsenite/antimonite-responsive transcriptional repressor